MEQDSSLVEILSLLIAAILAASVSSRLGFGSILGYLVGGALIGPWGLALIKDAHDVAAIGEFGVVFLLFLIGIELKPARLWVMRRLVFGLGGAQVALTGGVLAAAAVLLVDLPLGAAVVIGFGLALSSTAIGVQTLASHDLLSSHWGRASFSILLFQDLAVVPLLALVPLLNQRHFDLGASFGFALAEAVAILTLVIVGGRLAIKPALRWTAGTRSPEVFTGFALLLVLGIGWLTQHAGMSMAMGAFLAGILLSDSEYRHQVEADILPFRGLLLGLFFMSVGMGIDLTVLLDRLGVIVLLLAAILAIKLLIVVGLTRFHGLSLGGATQSGFLLAQAGEFCFVLFSYAQTQGVIPASLAATLIPTVALGMAITPLMFRLGGRIDAWLRHRQPDGVPDFAEEEKRLVLIAGFGRVGENVAALLKRFDIPHAAIDNDAANVEKGRARGFKVYFGDARRQGVLQAAGCADARLLVVTMDKTAAVERTVEICKRHFPHLKLIVRARDAVASEELYGLGVDLAVPETFEASLRLGAEAARAMGADFEAVTGVVRALREASYRAMSDEGERAAVSPPTADP